MTKKQMQMQKKALQPSAIINSKQPGKEAAYAILNEQERANIAKLSVRARGALEIEAYERGINMTHRYTQRVIDAILYMKDLETKLFRRCDHIDVLAATLEGQQLQDALSGDISAAVEGDYKTIVAAWNEMNRVRVLARLAAMPDYHVVKPEVAEWVKSRLEALKALKDGDFTPIQSLKPLDHELDKLLKRVKKQGRGTVKSDWLTMEAKRLSGEGLSPARIVNHLKGMDQSTMSPEQIADVDSLNKSADPAQMIKKRINR